MDFRKIDLTQKWFALLAEDQNYGFKYSLSQWLMLSQLSSHIKLCNPVCHLGALGNSNLCGVSRKWDLLRVPFCALSIWKQMLSDLSEVCDCQNQDFFP